MTTTAIEVLACELYRRDNAGGALTGGVRLAWDDLNPPARDLWLAEARRIITKMEPSHDH